MNVWINRTIKVRDSWGLGATHSLSTPTGQPPEFSLRPRHLRDAQGSPQCAHFSIDFHSGFLADGWQGVNFIPMGRDPVSGISNLPPWDPGQRDVYQQAINAAASSLDDGRTVRLEGVIPHLGSTGVGYNKVKLFYVEKAVQGSVPDLIVIRIATHAQPDGSVQGRQTGNGHGPP